MPFPNCRMRSCLAVVLGVLMVFFSSGCAEAVRQLGGPLDQTVGTYSNPIPSSEGGSGTIDDLLKNHSEVDTSGDLRRMQEDGLPRPGGRNSSLELANAISAERKSEHDRRYPLYPGRRKSDRFVITSSKDLNRTAGIRRTMKADQQSDGLPHWNESNYTMDLNSVIFSR